MAVIIFTFNDVMFNPNKWKGAFYQSLKSGAWAACLGWISFSCFIGQGGEKGHKKLFPQSNAVFICRFHKLAAIQSFLPSNGQTHLFNLLDTH